MTTATTPTRRRERYRKRFPNSQSTTESESTGDSADGGYPWDRSLKKMQRSSCLNVTERSPTSVALHLDLGGSFSKAATTAAFPPPAATSSAKKKHFGVSKRENVDATTTERPTTLRTPLSTEASRQHVLERMKDDYFHRKPRPRPPTTAGQNAFDMSRQSLEQMRGAQQSSYYQQASAPRIHQPSPLVGMVVTASKKKNHYQPPESSKKRSQKRSKSVSAARSSQQRSEKKGRRRSQSVQRPMSSKPSLNREAQRRSSMKDNGETVMLSTPNSAGMRKSYNHYRSLMRSSGEYEASSQAVESTRAVAPSSAKPEKISSKHKRKSHHSGKQRASTTTREDHYVKRKRHTKVSKHHNFEHHRSKHDDHPFSTEQQQDSSTTKFTLTKGLLKQNDRVASTQSHLQTAVATCIQMRKGRGTTSSTFLPFQVGGGARCDQWQSCYRGYFIRRHANAREIDVLRIQNGSAMRHVWTGYFADIEFHLNLIDIITIQSVVRRRACMLNFERARDAAIQIQRIIRQFLAVMWVDEMRRQRMREKRRQRARRRRHGAAIAIQTSWRAYVAFADYDIAKSAIILLQATVRRFLRQCQAQQDAAVVIQTCWRGFTAHANFFEAIWCIIAAQALVRRFLVLCRQRHALSLLQNNAAICIQKGWRGYTSRLDYVDAIWSAIEIQSAVRRFLERCRFLEQLTMQHDSAIVIQSSWRLCLATFAFQQLVRDAMVRQQLEEESFAETSAHYFDNSSSEEESRSEDTTAPSQTGSLSVTTPSQAGSLSMATQSQADSLSTFFDTQSTYTFEPSAQSGYPSIPEDYYVQPPEAIQSAVALDQPVAAGTESAAAAVGQQQDSQGGLSNGAVAAIAGASAIAGAAVGGLASMAARRGSSRARRRRPSIRIQSAVTIQTAVRRHLALVVFTRLIRSAIQIQALARGVAGRKEAERVKEFAALQHYKRASTSPSHGRRKGPASAFFIQSAARRMKKKVVCKKRTSSATTIQTAVRRYQAMRDYRTLVCGITRLSALHRGTAAKKEFAKMRHAALLIQSLTRGAITRVNLLIFHFAACEIQRSWRGRRDRCGNEAMVAAAIVIQSHVRRRFAAKKREVNRRASLQRQASESNPQSSEGNVSLSKAEDLISTRADVHAQLLGFESKRRATYAPVLKSSFLKWRSSVDSLHTSVEEMVNAERLIFGSAVACDAMMDLSVDGASFCSEVSPPEGRKSKLFSFQRGRHNDDSVKSGNDKDGYMEISDEMTLVRAELEHKVNVLSELGDSLIGELESAEMGVIEAWDGYDAAAMDAFGRDTAVRTQAKTSSKHRANKTERGADLWLEEMRYRVSVAFQVLAWQRATTQLSKIFESMSKTERKHRTRLRELLLVFASRRRQEVSSYASLQGQDLEQMVDRQVDQIHPQIEELIRETESRPFAETPREFLRVEANDFTTLDSPMTSRLLRSAKILEKKNRKGMRTCWNRTLAVMTADSFLHLFDMSSSSDDITEADEAFHELIVVSQLQKLDLHTELFEGLTPVDSLYLPNCVIKQNSKEKRNFDIREEYVGKLGKVTSRKLQLRAGLPEEVSEWMVALESQDKKF